MLRGMMIMEAVHSTALSCGCGRCTACRASAGDQDAIAEVYDAVAEDQDRRRQDTSR
jgi:hypothetical protein